MAPFHRFNPHESPRRIRFDITHTSMTYNFAHGVNYDVDSRFSRSEFKHPVIMTVHKGGCLCGQVRYTFDGEPEALAVCHCIPCRKLTSASASHNFVIKDENLHITGELRNFTRKGDSGKDVTYGFCTTCPTVVTVDAKAMEGLSLIKAGTCDDEKLLRETTPAQEIYCKNRYPWLKPIDGAEQHESA